MEARHSLGLIYGEIVRSAELSGLILAEHRYHRRLRMPAHWHDYAHFYFVLEGGCVDTYARSETQCAPLTLLFHPAGARHAADYGESGAHTFQIELLPQWLKRVEGRIGDWDRSWEFRGGLPCWVATRLYNEFRSPDVVTPLAVEGMVLELLAEVTRRQQGGGERGCPRWLRQARERLAAEPADPPSLTSLARAVGVHPTHLAREFRRYFRCSPGEYLRGLRLEQARRELAISDTPLAQIAVTAGFADHSHFCRAFKRHTGLTPSEFRRRHRLR